MCHRLSPLQKNHRHKSFVISSCEENVWIRPRFICIPRLVVDTPQEERLPRVKTYENVIIQVTPHKAALWGGGGGESKFVDELMKPFRGNNAVSRDFTTLFRVFLCDKGYIRKAVR